MVLGLGSSRVRGAAAEGSVGGTGREVPSFRWGSAGARAGFSATSLDDGFHQIEAWSRLETPWVIDLGAGWDLGTAIEASAGVLSRGDDHGFIGGLGPVLSLRRQGWPVALELGSEPTLISRQEFEQSDFSFPLQFTSYLGARVDLGRRFLLGYRFQHMSNASLGEDNPGLNLHMFSVGWRF